MQKLLSLIRSHLFIFVFSLHYSRRWVIEDLAVIYVILSFSMFFSKSFPVSGLTFRSLTHFEFIFVYVVRKNSNFIPLQYLSRFPSTTYWSDYLFSILYSCPFVKDKVHIGSYLKFIHFYFVVLYMIFKAFTLLVFIWLLLFSHSVVSDSVSSWAAATRLLCPSLSPRAWSNSCPLSRWCHPTILPSIIPFSSCLQYFPALEPSNESALHIRWPKYWGFSFSISPSNEYSRFISFRIDWFDLLVAQGALKSLLQHHSSKSSILWHSAFFMV